MDVYERESTYFFADSSAKVIHDDVFARLLSFYNVFMTFVAPFFKILSCWNYLLGVIRHFLPKKHLQILQKPQSLTSCHWNQLVTVLILSLVELRLWIRTKKIAWAHKNLLCYFCGQTGLLVSIFGQARHSFEECFIIKNKGLLFQNWDWDNW